MFILSGFSVWLTLGGFYSIITCFCPAYFAYRVIFSESCGGWLVNGGGGGGGEEGGRGGGGEEGGW